MCVVYSFILDRGPYALYGPSLFVLGFDGIATFPKSTNFSNRYSTAGLATVLHQLACVDLVFEIDGGRIRHTVDGA